MFDNPYHNIDLSNKKILITGGAGFIGSHIADYLMKYNVEKLIVLDDLSNGNTDNIQQHLDKDNFEFQIGTITDIVTCRKVCSEVDYIFHQAALGSVPRSIEFPLATNNANVNGTLNLLVAAKEANVKRIVYASSSSVYGNNEDIPKKEEKTGQLLSPYAVSKKVGEDYAYVFSNLYGLDIVGLRYFNIFGPKQDPNGPYAAAIPLFIEALLNNKSPFINGDGSQSRDFTFVENAVQANIKAMFADNKNIAGEVFNIAFGGATSVNDLFESIKKITGSQANAIHRQERQGDIKNSNADISKAQKAFGYNPTIGIEKGLELTIDWFKNRK